MRSGLLGRGLGPAESDEIEEEAAESDGTSARALRERGAELLRLSADIHYEEDSHPAYARILDVMAPDEARILRLLMENGAQPSDIARDLLKKQGLIGAPAAE